MTQQIIDKFDRKKLGEGRNYGLGFSILKKIDNNTFETLMAFTACKDYLNDFVYVETTGKALGSIYGFKHEYTGILKDQEYFYVGLKALHYNSGIVYNEFNKVQDTLKDNYKNIIKAINKMEQVFNLTSFTTLENYFDNTLILKTPIFWTKFSFIFSLYGLFIRCLLNVTEEESKLETSALLESKKDTLIGADAMMLQPMKKFFAKPDVGKLLDFKYAEPVSPGIIHNGGINTRLGVVCM